MTTFYFRCVRKEFLLWLVLLTSVLFPMVSNAITYYSRSSGANWNSNFSWSTTNYGGAPGFAFPVAGDTVNIANGITVFVNTTSACSQINIGQGTSGILQFGSTGSFTLTVSGDINVRNGAKLLYNSNNTRTHTLKIGGDLVNNGIVDLVYDANDRVNIVFNGASNSIVSGAGTWSLNNVTLGKTAVSDYLQVESPGFENAIATLVTTTGTYIHDNNSTYSINASAAANYVISELVVFKVPQGTVWFSPNSTTLFLEGSLYVNGGTVYVGTNAGTKGLVYRQPAGVIPYLEVTAGFLDVYGGIFNNLADPFSFKMSGGTILLNNGTSGTSQGVFYQNDLAESVFDMSGGTIVIEKHNNVGATNVDWGICGTNGNVNTTGGTVQFGDAATPAGSSFDFVPFPNVVQPNFKVTGPAGAAISLQPSKSSTANFKLLSLYIDLNKTFDNRSIQGINGDSKNMTLTGNFDGVYAFYNDGTFTGRTGTVTFAGSSAQSMGGASVSTFYNLTINASADITLETAEKVSNYLLMTSGNLVTTSANILTCTSSASASPGSVSSFVNGPMIHTIATTAPTTKTFPIGKGLEFRPASLTVTHLTATSVTYKGEVFNASAAALGYNLPSTLGRVSDTRYWDFTRQNVSNFSNGFVNLFYDSDDGVSDKNNVSVAHDDGSFNWVDMGGAASANITGNIVSGTISSFKRKFALGFPPSSLPIQLISFDAVKSGNNVKCEWSTASEINNDYFTIERSPDGTKFDSILSVKGAGNSSGTLHYSAMDENPLQGDSYYRLKQTNHDGKSGYSDAVHVYIERASGYKLFPNPSPGNMIFINKNGEELENVSVVVQDMSGREVRSSTTISKNKKELFLDIEPSSYVKNNTYIVSIMTGNRWIRERVLVSGNR